MIKVLSGVWPLLIGIVFIMLGNGMHFTLIGLRGGIESFSSLELAIVTSGYFIGFLSGARLCGTWQFYVGGADHISLAGRTLDLDAPADTYWFLYVWCLCHG